MTCTYGEILHKPLSQEHNHSSCSHAHAHSCDASSHTHTHKISNSKALMLSLGITVIAMIIQLVYSFITNSLALLSDTLHMLTHALALALSYFALYAAKNYSHELKSFGYWRAEIIAALINAVFIGLVGLFIIFEALHKLLEPSQIAAGTMLIVAIFGLCVNIITGLIMMQGDLKNLNVRSAFLHMMSDLLSSVAIIIGGVIVYYTQFYFIDAIIAAIIAAVIGKWGFDLARQSINILLESSPIAPNSVQAAMCEVPKVRGVHDLHITQITDKMLVLTAHIVIERDDMYDFGDIISKLGAMLKERFGIAHITIQPEWKE